MEKLTVKSLQIGDWVFHEKYGNVIIESIDNDFGDSPSVMVISENIKHKEGYTYGYKWCTLEDIFPIPFTPEILEKNGFIRDPLWHHCDKDLDNYSISVQLGYANRIEYIKIAEKGKDNVIPSERTKLYLTHIKYVHQFQHALRFCGIEKEIKL